MAKAVEQELVEVAASREATREAAVREMARYVSDCRNEDGIVSQAMAARYLGIATATLSQAINRGRFVVFEYPALGLKGLSVKQVKAYHYESKVGIRGRGHVRGLVAT